MTIAVAKSFREELPDLNSDRFRAISTHDALTWADEFYKNPFAKELTGTWLALYHEPFVGLTTNG